MIHPVDETDAGTLSLSKRGEHPARDSRPGRRIAVRGSHPVPPTHSPLLWETDIQSSPMPSETPTCRRQVALLFPRGTCPIQAEPVHEQQVP